VKGLFIFNIEKNNNLPEEYYKKLISDEVYMDYFLNLPGPKKIDAIEFEGEIINQWDLNKKYKKEPMRTIIDDYIKYLEIKVDISTVEYVVNFLDSKDFMRFMVLRTVKKSK
jgi:hypothetical protein